MTVCTCSSRVPPIKLPTFGMAGSGFLGRGGSGLPLYCLYRQPIAVKPEAAYYAEAGTAYHGTVAELLPTVDIGYVDLDDRTPKRTDTILQGNTRVGVGTSVEHDAVDTFIAAESRLLHAVDETTLNVALIVVYLNVGKQRA